VQSINASVRHLMPFTQSRRRNSFFKNSPRKSHEKSSVKASFVLIEQPQSTLARALARRPTRGRDELHECRYLAFDLRRLLQIQRLPKEQLRPCVYVCDSQDFNQQLAHRCLQSIFLPAAAGPKLSHAHTNALNVLSQAARGLLEVQGAHRLGSLCA
jgi:hypothetical protein